MALTQGNSGSVWNESIGAGAGVAIEPAHYIESPAGTWMPSLVSDGNPTAARALDFGEGYTLVDVANGFKLISDGASGLLLVATTDPAAEAGCVVDDGAGGLLVSTDTAAVRGGSLFGDGNGGAVAVRNDAAELLLMKVGNDFITYE